MPIHLHYFDRSFEVIYSEFNVHIYHYVHYSDLFNCRIHHRKCVKINLGQHELHGYLEI